MALAVTMTETMSPSTMVKRPSMAAEMLQRFSNLLAGPADVSHSRPGGAPDADSDTVKAPQGAVGGASNRIYCTPNLRKGVMNSAECEAWRSTSWVCPSGRKCLAPSFRRVRT